MRTLAARALTPPRTRSETPAEHQGGSAPRPHKLPRRRRGEMIMQDHRPFDVTHHCTIHHGHAHPGILAFDKDHPFAVELVFMPEMVSYVFARDLLFQAAIQGVGVGEGDVIINPDYSHERGAHLVLVLNDYDGEVYVGTQQLVLDRRVAQKFLYATFDHVPIGEEDYSAQVDAFLLTVRTDAS